MSESSARQPCPTTTTTPTRTPTTSQASLSEDSDDELEFNSDASVSEDSEVEGEEEVLVMEERVEEDAKIQEFSIYLTLLNCLVLLMSPAKKLKYAL